LTEPSSRPVVFDEGYYREVIERNGYDPLEFESIEFTLGRATEAELRSKWLCHHQGAAVAQCVARGGRAIVTTGVGLSGAPHLGTISQITRAIFLQRAGLDVQFVLGDLDSYNARNQSLSVLAERAQQYEEFIVGLGFDTTRGTLRRQRDHLQILQTAYLIANVLRDEDFRDAEEDLSELYKSRGIYPGMEFPVKQAILLMIADFIHLGDSDGYDAVLVMLGLEEHLYVQLARKVVGRMNLPFALGAIYSRVVRGLGGFPKMSKSIPGSAITVDTAPDEIVRMLAEAPANRDPWDSTAFQIACASCAYSAGELDALAEACRRDGPEWTSHKLRLAEIVVELVGKWPR
jgi:tryptophanyl-tRNA synthetase